MAMTWIWTGMVVLSLVFAGFRQQRRLIDPLN